MKQAAKRQEWVCESHIRGKVSTRSTTLIVNNLSVYKKVYNFLKVSTALIANDLSVNINDKVAEWINSVVPNGALERAGFRLPSHKQLVNSYGVQENHENG